MKWFTIKCSLRLLLVFCCTTVCSYMYSEMKFGAAFNPFTHSMVHCEVSYENPVVLSMYNHLWAPLLVSFAHITIKWYQTVLQRPVRLEFPNSIKLKSCTEGSLHHVRNIPVSGCFSPRQVILEQLAFPASSLLLWVVQHLATQRCFTKK